MAKLHRLVKSEDRQNTHVFTFILPISLGADSAKEIISPEFMCGHQKWNIALTKQEKDSYVGAYLTLKNPSPGLYVTVDYGFSLLNRGHYTQNESFMDTNKVFNKQNPKQGRKAFISTNDIKNPARGFLMEKDQLFLEVTVCNFKTHFEYQLQLPMTDKDRQKYPPNDVRMETGFFPFGGSEWNVNLKINERNPNDIRGGTAVTLRRLSNFDHYCKFKYRIHIGVIEPTPLPGTVKPAVAAKPVHNTHNKVISSNEMDSLFIDADTQDKLVLPTNIYKLATVKGVITIKIECLQSIILTLLQIPMDRNRHRALRCYDRDKQAWLFEAHMKSDKLKFYVFYGDIATVPRGCIRMMNIGVSVLPAYGNVKLVRGINSPYTKYYIQKQQDDFGLEVPTGIPMKDIIDTKSIYIYDNTNTLTVQIEWGDSYLLKDIDYSTTDNVIRLHKMQMEKEMKIIQKENLNLEKQVHSYQTAIAQKDSKGEFDPNQMAIRPQPTGQAQPGYAEYPGERMHNHLADAYNRGPSGMMPGQYNSQAMTSGGYPGSIAQSNMSQMMQGAGPSDTNYHGNSYGRGNAGSGMDHQQYDRQSRAYGPDDHHMPVPADRGPRSKSADPNGSPFFSPVPERRPNRRRSTTGAEYADYLEQPPNSRHNRSLEDRYRNYDGYRSDSGYRSDTMAKQNDPRYADVYNKPRPTIRGKGSDTRSDYGDYYSERRSKAGGYDRDIDACSDRSYKSSGGGRSGKSAMIDRRNMMNSAVTTGRSSYAGYEGEYLSSEHQRISGSPYPPSMNPGNMENPTKSEYPQRMRNGPI